MTGVQFLAEFSTMYMRVVKTARLLTFYKDEVVGTIRFS